MTVCGQDSLYFNKQLTPSTFEAKQSKFSLVKHFTLDHNSLLNFQNESLLTIELEGEQAFTIEVNNIDILTSDHLVNLSVSQSPDKLQVELDSPILVLNGTVNSLRGSYAGLTVSDHGIEGFIATGNHTYYIEKIRTESSKDYSEYIFYKSQDVIDKSIHCLVNQKQANSYHHDIKKSITNDCLTIDLAVAVDYKYFQIYNYNVTEVIARTITVLNATASDYATVFNNSISFNITEHFIATCENCEPWGNAEDAVFLLEEFSHWSEDGGFTKPFHLGQLWTGGDLKQDQSSNTIGYAFKAGLCSDKRYHVLEDFSESLWKLRFLTTHEIGHNLNCNHDLEGSNTIMSPTVNNSSTWSDNSIEDVNAFVNGISCVQNCHENGCQKLTGFALDSYTSSSLNISWTTGDSTRVSIIDEKTGDFIFNKIIDEKVLIIKEDFSNCNDYRLVLHTICKDEESTIIGVTLGNPEETFTNIVDMRVFDCLPSSTADYKLEFLIEHNGVRGESFYIDILGNTTAFTYESSPQVIQLDASQINTNQDKFPIQLFTILQSKLYCLDQIIFDNKPNESCDLFVHETFNDCRLPYNWEMTSSNQDYFSFPYSWQFDDNSRKILNYAKSNNAHKEKTLDGSCMAYFDDDINSRTQFSGNIIMYSDEYDLRNHTNVELSFIYLFHDFSDIKNSNESYFAMEVWDGSAWITVLLDNEILCPWSDVWNANCSKIFTINLDQYAHENLQCRFIYSDGNKGEWTGMIALDNFILTGDRILNYGCTNPEALNYDPSADVDNGLCYSCENGLKDGQETGIDCGGPDCERCIFPCSQEEMSITEIASDMTISDVDRVYISAIIEQNHVLLKPGIFAKLNPGFEVQLGATLEATISLCQD